MPGKNKPHIRHLHARFLLFQLHNISISTTPPTWVAGGATSGSATGLRGPTQATVLSLARLSRSDAQLWLLMMVQVIWLRFSHVSLWAQPASDTAAARAMCSDVDDRLTVQERRRKPICVTATTNIVVTRTNHAAVRFVTNELGHALGFRAFYRAGPPFFSLIICLCQCVGSPPL